MNLDDIRRKSQLFKFEGHEVRYRVEGNGEWLLCLHGFPTSSLDWRLVTPELAKHFKIVTFDMLGYGLSDKPANFGYTVPAQTNVAQALMDFLGVQECHLLTHDYGALVALELLLRHQRADSLFTVKSLFALNATVYNDLATPKIIQKVSASPVGSVISRIMNKRLFSKNLREVFGEKNKPSDADMDLFWDLFSYQDGHRNLHKLLSYIRERKEFGVQWAKAWERNKAPSMLICGAEDPVSTTGAADQLRRRLPNTTVIEMSCGHYAQLEAPDAILEHYFQFHEKYREEM